MAVRTIHLAKRLKFEPIARGISDSAFERALPAVCSSEGSAVLRNVLHRSIGNAFSVSYELMDKASQDADSNLLFGAGQFFKWNFWSAIYHLERTRRISPPSVPNRMDAFIERLESLRTAGTPPGEKPICLFAPADDLSERFRKLGGCPEPHLFEEQLRIAASFFELVSGLLRHCIDSSRSLSPDNPSHGSFLAECLMLSALPTSAQRVCDECLEDASVDPIQRLTFLNIKSSSEDLKGNTARAASILTGVPFGAAALYPETIVRCYGFLKSSNQPKVAKTYVEKMYSESRRSAGVKTPLSELSLASPGARVWHRFGIIRKIPPILISTISKSGSTFMPKVISNRLVIPSTKIFAEHAENHHKELIPEALKIFAKGGVLCRQHFSPDDHVLRRLSEGGIKKILFHVRDPRQALISWVIFMESALRKHTIPGGYVIGISPFRYGRFGLKEKIDFHIDRFFIRTLELIESWIDAKQNRPYGIEIKFTRFEDMVDDPQTFFADIFAFFGVRENRFFSASWDLFRHLSKRRSALKKRSGKKDEWRTILTPSQQRRITALTPPRVRALFPEHDWSFEGSNNPHQKDGR